MNLRQFKYVLGVAEQQNFTRAAEVLNVSQPALSQMIRNLEEELSIQIFSRSPHSVTITEAGKLVIEHAKQALNITKSLEEKIADYRGLKSGAIKIGILQTFGAFYLPEILLPFLKSYPEIHVHVAELSNDEIHQQVEQGELNLGIAFSNTKTSNDVVNLYSDELAYVCSPNHRFSEYQSLPLSVLAEERLALLPSTFSTRQDIDRLFKDQGIKSPNIVTFNTFSTILAAVNKGLCLSITPANARRVSPSLNLHFGKLDPSPPQKKIGLIRGPKGLNTPASKIFAQMVIQHFHE